MNARGIAESILGAIEWDGAEVGFCQCPGIGLHTKKDGDRDCKVMLDGAPTIACFHTSCSGVVDDANRRLRSAIGKAERGQPGASQAPRQPTPEELERRRAKEAQARLELRSRRSLSRIIETHRVPLAEVFESSPVRLLDDPKDGWRLLLRLFPEDGVVWIGDKKDSCNDHADEERKGFCRRRFRSVRDWLRLGVGGAQFTCPSLFRPGVHSRSNANVVRRPFLVVESDSLRHEEMMAVFNWMRQFMRLRAVVDTAGKSLHGWFEFPRAAVLAELRVILKVLGCDPALFREAQPCRLPGAMRDGKVQSLLWLDLEGCQ